VNDETKAVKDGLEAHSHNDSRRSARTHFGPIDLKAGRQVILVLVSIFVGITCGYVLTPETFSDSQQHTVFLLVFALLLWLTEAVPPFAVGLLIICFQLFAYGTPLMNSAPEDTQRYLNSFSSSVIFLMLGGFFLADAMRKTGLDREVFRLAVSLFGRQPGRVLLGLMLTTAVLSMIMSNTATTAMMIAAVTPFLLTYGPGSDFAKAVLVGIPAAASVGGMGTIIGSPPNAVAVGALEQAGVEVTFLKWMLLGAPLAIVLCLGFWFLLGLRYRWGEDPIEIELEPSEDIVGRSGRDRRIVIVTTAVTMVLWLTSSMHSVPVATVSAVPVAMLTVTGVLGARDMRLLPWDTIMLVAGGLALGLAIVDQGVAEYYLGQLNLGDARMAGLMLLFGYITVVLSNIMSNTATASILIPIAAVLLVGRSEFVTIAIALSASSALMLPVSTPPNAIAYSSGMIEAREFRYGGFLIGGITPILTVAWVWVLLTILR